MIRLSFIITFLFSSLFLNAQAELRGQIVDATGPLAFATLTVNNTDSLFVKGATTDLDGQFSVDLAPGTYLLDFSYLGYTSHQQSIELVGNQDLGAINLQMAAQELTEIVVTAQKQLIQRKTDRLVFNVSNSIAAQGNDLARALKLVPGVRLQNGSLELVGRGAVRVMVNDRLLALEGEELLAFLAGISADDIERVEVISNPPARYAAEGNAGLINIVYKTGRRNHWKNQSTLTYEQNRYGAATFRNSFSYHKNKSTLLFSLGGTKGSQWHTEYGASELASGTWEWESRLRMRRDDLNTRLAFDQELNDRLSVGVQYQGNWAQPNFRGPIETRIFNPEQTIDSILINNGINNRDRKNHLVNLHLIADLDSNGRRLSVDVDWLDYQNDMSLDYEVETQNAQGEGLRLHRAGLNNSLQGIRNYSFKADMIHPWRKVEFNYGARYSQIRSSNDLEVYLTNAEERLLDASLSNEFDYREDILALYFSANRQLSKAWQAQLGLRMEQTFTEGFSPTLQQRQNNQYFQLFPTLYLNYQANDNHQASLSLGRRINRPGFRDLNPFRIYLTNKAYSEGNPFLQASTTNTYNLTYVYRGRYTTNAFVNHTTNGFGTIFTADNETQIQATIRDNYYSAVNLGIGEQFSFSADEWWTSQNQVYLLYSHTNISEAYQAIPQNGPQLYLATNNTLLLNKEWSAQVDFWWSSNHQARIFEVGSTYSLDVSLRKKWLDQNLTLSIQASDILNTASLSSLVSEVNGVRSSYGQNYSSRNVRLTLSYSFGNDRIKVSKRSFGNQEEQNRS